MWDRGNCPWVLPIHSLNSNCPLETAWFLWAHTVSENADTLGLSSPQHLTKDFVKRISNSHSHFIFDFRTPSSPCHQTSYPTVAGSPLKPFDLPFMVRIRCWWNGMTWTFSQNYVMISKQPLLSISLFLSNIRKQQNWDKVSYETLRWSETCSKRFHYKSNKVKLFIDKGRFKLWKNGSQNVVTTETSNFQWTKKRNNWFFRKKSNRGCGHSRVANYSQFWLAFILNCS